jgi:transcriptional regulator with XRE-family HTH domain
MTRAQLGAKLGVNPRRIQEFEAGEDRISSNLLRNIVAEMAVPPTFFFEGLAGALAGGASQNRS